MRRLAPRLLCALSLATATPAFAIWDPSTAPYDLDTLGVPQFVDTLYIDLSRVSQLSKFRSNAGHNYTDSSQFGLAGYRGADNRVEDCRSMKHYFIAPDANTAIYAPVSGKVSGILGEGMGDQIAIVSDQYPAFEFILFHVGLDAPLTIGQHLEAGQRLGHHERGDTYSDIAVAVKTPRGNHLISYFETLTDNAFAAFQARGITSREQLIYSKEARDAAPFTCGGTVPFNANATLDYVSMTGGVASQTVSFNATPSLVRLTDGAVVLSAKASSGLPVAFQSRTPDVCTVTESSVSLAAPGICTVMAVQAGSADFRSAERQLNMTVIAGLNAGPVYGSQDAVMRSYVRFYNSGAAAGTVSVALYDADTGAAAGSWTSPLIPAGSQQQYYVGDLESGLAPDAAKPARYSLVINATFSGFFQHVVWRPTESILTNLTACDFGIGNEPLSVTSVRSSRISAGYSSTVIVRNAGSAPVAATLTLYDAFNGDRLGAFTTREVPTNGALALDAAALEAGARFVPGANIGHYVVKADATFTGFLQHIVTNHDAGGAIVDMTRQCALDGIARGRVTVSAATASARGLGLAYPSSSAGPQSVLRIFNTFPNTPGTVAVTLHDMATGVALGTWTSPSIPGGVAEFPISTLESALESGTVRPSVYTLTMVPTVFGFAQNLLVDTEAGTLTNVSACAGGFAGEFLTAPVHSSQVSGFDSTVVMNNTAAAAVRWNAPGAVLWNYMLFDGRGYTYIGGSPNYGANDVPLMDVPGHGAQALDIAAIETAIKRPPAESVRNYVFSAQAGYSGIGTMQAGFVQHLVTSRRSGMVDDLTYGCRLR